MSNPSTPRRWLPADLSLGERIALAAGVILLLVFGGIIEMRSAFLRRPMTDLQVYLRAAWAVRTGGDLYAITDDNHWHYHYTPLYAILMTPLADAPAGESRSGLLPFAVSVGLWYGFSLVCLALAAHALARALEETAGRPAERGSRRWWTLRLWPILACLPPIGQTLVRGQVNLLLLAVLCAVAAAVLRRQSLRAGSWLALAICLKVIPAFLIVLPLWRRDVRFLTGCALGLFVGLGIIPAAVLGPQRTLDYYQEWTDVLVRPALANGPDRSRAHELIDTTATDSQSPVAILHNLLHFDRNTRPPQASSSVRLAHWLIVGAMTLLTLLAAGRQRSGHPASEAAFLAALMLVMLFTSPVCHLHYFCLALPAAMLVVFDPASGPRLTPARLGLLGTCSLFMLLPSFPGLEALRDVGLSGLGAFLLWMAAVQQIRKSRQAPLPFTHFATESTRIAA